MEIFDYLKYFSLVEKPILFGAKALCSELKICSTKMKILMFIRITSIP